jgi:peptidoglycan DL-endopeptidase CwlO
MKRLSAICLLSCVTLLPVHGEEDTLGNVYHSLNRFGNHVKNTFAEASDDRPSPTPRRHRKSTSKTSSAKKASTKDPDSDNETAKANDSGENSKAKASVEAAKDDSPADTGKDKPAASPSPNGEPGQGADSGSKGKNESAAPMATIKPEALQEFSQQPARVQELLRNSLALTERNLNYQYGSADPAAGGMDCSGFIFYVLNNAGFKDVPRDSAGQYEWVRKSSKFHAVLSRSAETFELNDLRPGDLMFWSGTYKVERDIPITHVMIYLGKEKSSDKPVMVGATDGRSYEGVRRFGVSVFDFKMPSGKPNKSDADLTAKFEGYGSIPGLREADVAAKIPVPKQEGVSQKDEGPREKAKPSETLGNGD